MDDRFTHIDNDGWWAPDDRSPNCRVRGSAVGRLAAYEDTGLTPEEIRGLQFDDALDITLGVSRDRLRALAEADRDGRVVVLPCKVGDTVYEIARGLSIYKSGLHSYVNEHVATELNVFDWARQGDFGKIVFLTRAEAEAALGKER